MEVSSAAGDCPAAGDRAEAFDRLVAGQRRRITRLVHRLLGWSGEVEDVVQDVFLAAWRRFDQFRGEATAATWLTRIAINRCRTHRRRQWVRRRWRRAMRAAATEPSPPDAPAQHAHDQERLAHLRDAIARLPHRDREVIVLHYLDELAVDEVARLLGVARNTVEVRLHRARRRLGKALGQVAF